MAGAADIKVVTVGVVGPAGAGVTTHEAIGNTIMHVRQVTSSTRPSTPLTGQVIYETDTGYYMEWNGTIWTPLATPAVAAYAYRSAALSPVTATTTTIGLDGEDAGDDSFGFHDPVTNNSRMTVPAGLAGWYIVSAEAEWAANAVGRRLIQVLKNGAGTPIARCDFQNDGTGMRTAVAAVVKLAAGDFIEMQVYQDSGAGLALTVGKSTVFFSIGRFGA